MDISRSSIVPNPSQDSRPVDHRGNLFTAQKVLAIAGIVIITTAIALTIFIAFLPASVVTSAMPFVAVGSVALNGVGAAALVGSLICFFVDLKLSNQ